MPLIIALTALAVVGIYDGYCQYQNKPTVSSWTWHAAQKYPFFPFAAGLIMGHLFWSNSGACQ